MQAIKVNKAELREKIEANRAGHRAIFEEAVEGYRTQVVEQLEDVIEKVKSGKLLRVSVALPLPEDHTDDYDRVLAMLDMDLNDEIELEEHDFACYVLDDWMWKRQFLASNSSYSATAAAALS